MASRLNPYLSFSDNAREAMEYYERVFGGNLTVNTFGEFGAGDSAQADKVMHALLETPSGYTTRTLPREWSSTPGTTWRSA